MTTGSFTGTKTVFMLNATVNFTQNYAAIWTLALCHKPALTVDGRQNHSVFFNPYEPNQFLLLLLLIGLGQQSFLQC